MHFTLSDYLADITANSIEADASEVSVLFSESGEFFEMTVEDNGCGMDEETLKKATDPFYTDPNKHAARKAGFGLPFLIQACELCGGSFSIESQKSVGTKVVCSFRRDCIDTPPVGNLVSSVTALMTMDGGYDLQFVRHLDGDEYEVRRSELQEALGELETAGSINLVRTFVSSLEEDVQLNKQEKQNG